MAQGALQIPGPALVRKEVDPQRSWSHSPLGIGNQLWGKDGRRGISQDAQGNASLRGAPRKLDARGTKGLGLLPRAARVLLGKPVDRELRDAEARAFLKKEQPRLNPGGISLAPGQAALLGPTPIAIRYEADVPGETRELP